MVVSHHSNFPTVSSTSLGKGILEIIYLFTQLNKQELHELLESKINEC